jgi:predicted O-methyltransferase YrrM
VAEAVVSYRDWLAVAESAVGTHYAVQKPAELAELLELLATDVRPRRVLEIGSDAGGTLWAWRQLPTVSQVCAISLAGGPFSTGRRLQVDVQRLLHVGDSHSPGAHLWAIELKPFDFLFLDGDHTEAGVRRDLELYAPLVAPGGLIALHDVLRHPAQPSVGVWRVWTEIVAGPCWHWEIGRRPYDWGGIGVFNPRPPAAVRD